MSTKLFSKNAIVSPYTLLFFNFTILALPVEKEL